MAILIALLNGDVQCRGVRSSVCAAARKLNLTGTATNRPDGSVEVHAFGKEEDIKSLYEELSTAPSDNRNLVQTVTFTKKVPKHIRVPDSFTQGGSHY